MTGGNPDTTKTFSVAAGSASALPPGLSLDPVTGEVTGTPTAPGTYAVTFKVTDNSPNMEDTASLPSGSAELPANADTYVVTFTIAAGPVVADGSFGQGMESYPYTLADAHRHGRRRRPVHVEHHVAAARRGSPSIRPPA